MTERTEAQKEAINAEKERYADMLEKGQELAVVASTSFFAAWEMLQRRNEKAAS